MRRFLYKIALLTLPFFICSILGISYLNYYLKKNEFYRIDPKIRILFIGDSHIECSLNDSLIARSKNLAQSADTYFYTFYKLKKLIEANPSIDTVILGFPGNLFYPERDNWVYGEEYLGNKYPKYLHLISIQDQFFLFFKNPKSILIATKDALKTNFDFFFKKPIELYNKLGWGGYLYLVRDNITKVKNDFSKISSTTKSSISLSPLSNRSLKKCMAICKERNITLILFNAPLHKFSNKDYQPVLDNYLKSELKNVLFWDYSNFPLGDDEFGDLSHLNYKGAKHFSAYLNIVLNQSKAAAK